MASDCFILANDNIFNRTVLSHNALYYQSHEEVTSLLNQIETVAYQHKEIFIQNNLDVIRKEYSWKKLVDEHEKYFQWLLEQNKK